MLFRKEFLEGIRTGAVRLTFRRWRQLSVCAGRTLLTSVGQLSIKVYRTSRAEPDLVRRCPPRGVRFERCMVS